MLNVHKTPTDTTGTAIRVALPPDTHRRFVNPSPTLADRFWARVDRNGPVPAHCPELGPCWLWTGNINRQTGYGSLPYGWHSARGYTVRGYAHRISWELHAGAIPEGLFVLHKCDNKACVRHDHHFLGTQAENIADKVGKGRHFSKIDAEIAAEMYECCALGEPQSKIADRFGVSTSLVSLVLTGQRFAEVRP